MMNKTILVLSLVAGIAFTSCKKEGCIDSDATNYDEKAKTDEGSCTYKADFVIWFNQEAADNMTDDGITEMTFYLDGKNLGTLSPDDYSTSIPQCDGAAGLNTVLELGNSKRIDDWEFSYTDNFGNVQGSGSYPGIDANECYQYQIYYYN